jgi:hypothetical protein
MGRILLSRLRRVAPDPGWLIAFAAMFLFVEGLLRYLEFFRNIPIFARLPLRPGNAIMFVASMQYGLRRAVEFHPIWSEGYRTWLESTPWTNQKPLPMGPVQLVWEDGLVVGSMMLLNAILPEPHSWSILCAFLLGHLLGLTMTLFMTRRRAIGYVTAFGLGLALWLVANPIACAATATLVYLIAYEGLWRGLAQFPWKPRAMPDFSDLSNVGAGAAHCGWPFDRMIRDVLGQGISRIDAVICCALGSWWLFVLSSFFHGVESRMKLLVVPFCLFMVVLPILRLAIYIDGHRSPVNIWGRIMTGRWIIPRYDQVFIAPLLIVVAGPLSVYCLHAARLPLDVAATIGIGMMTAVALVAPPRLRRWRLTGQHRIVPAIPTNQPKAKAQLVQVG